MTNVEATCSPGYRRDLHEEEPTLIPIDSHVVVHGPDGTYLMEKIQWPKLTLSSKIQDSKPIESIT